MRFQPFLTALVAAILGIMTETDLRAGDEPSDKPRGLAFEEWLKTKEGSVNGVLIRLTKTESVETDPKVSDRVVILKLNWSINYDGKRWPLVILEPSLANETSGQTCVHVVAIGRSGKEYRSLIDSPSPIRAAQSEKKWFRELDKDKPALVGTVEADLSIAKKRFIKYYPDEFSPDVTPDIYVMLEHLPIDRGQHLRLDAWTGDLSTSTKKVLVKKW